MIKDFFAKIFKQKRFSDTIAGSNSRHDRSFSKLEFNDTMYFVREVLEYEKDEADQLIILDYILSVVREDLKTDMLTTILYNEEIADILRCDPFPVQYFDEEGNAFSCTSKRDKDNMVKVDLSKDCVLVLSWNRERLKKSIKNIFKNDFEYHSSNHLANYFSHIDVCYVDNGTHSISSGIGHKKGFIEAVYCDTSKFFEHLHTDGVYWYNSHNNNKISDLFDFRIGILYEIAKIRSKISN